MSILDGAFKLNIQLAKLNVAVHPMWKLRFIQSTSMKRDVASRLLLDASQSSRYLDRTTRDSFEIVQYTTQLGLHLGCERSSKEFLTNQMGKELGTYIEVDRGIVIVRTASSKGSSSRKCTKETREDVRLHGERGYTH